MSKRDGLSADTGYGSVEFKQGDIVIPAAICTPDSHIFEIINHKLVRSEEMKLESGVEQFKENREYRISNEEL
jgi:hypothetical protein